MQGVHCEYRTTESYDNAGSSVSRTYTPPTDDNHMTGYSENGQTTTFTYDEKGNRTSAAPPGDSAISYTYDTENRMINVARTSPSANITYGGGAGGGAGRTESSAVKQAVYIRIKAKNSPSLNSLRVTEKTQSAFSVDERFKALLRWYCLASSHMCPEYLGLRL